MTMTTRLLASAATIECSRDRHGAGIDLAVSGLGVRRTRADRMSLRARKRFHDVLFDAGQQIGEGGIGQSRLRTGCDAAEDPRAGALCHLGAGAQKGGLADAGLALEHEHR